MPNRMKLFAFAAIAAGSMAVTAPQTVAAQGKSQGKSHGKSQVKTQEKGRVGTQARAEHGDDKNGKGPAFCRSGAGHPVHGRQWCIDKGFGLGNARWGNSGWGDVIFGRNTSRKGTVSQSTLSNVLGSVIFGRLQKQYGTSPMTGNWINSSTGPLLLQVQTGGRPIAEFVDRNRDGKAEVVLLNLSH